MLIRSAPCSCRSDVCTLLLLIVLLLPAAGMSHLSQLSTLHMEYTRTLGAYACSALLAKIAAAPALRTLNLNLSVMESG